MLAFSRMPGNAFSFWIRKTLRWSRGLPELPHEGKENLFAYLGATPQDRSAAEARERELAARYDLEPLARASTAALYRKNVYLIDLLERACEGLPLWTGAGAGADRIKAADIGSQDWHYVFGLERWLRHAGPAGPGRAVELLGIEVDGYGIYPDFRSRLDYARAYAAQTGNTQVTYRVADFLKAEPGTGAGAKAKADVRTGAGGFGVQTWFYPFVTRHHLLLWGLPLRFFRPAQMLAKAAQAAAPGGWLVVFTHTLKEHELFLEFGRASGLWQLMKEGPAVSKLVDFHEDVEDRRFSVWRKISA